MRNTKYKNAVCNLPRGREVVSKYVSTLNKEYGWELSCYDKEKKIKEFSIPSGRTAKGRFYFDGVDLKRLIFFEFNGVEHNYGKDTKTMDAEKKARLKDFLSRHGVSGRYVVYNQLLDQLTIETLS